MRITSCVCASWCLFSSNPLVIKVINLWKSKFTLGVGYKYDQQLQSFLLSISRTAALRRPPFHTIRFQHDSLAAAAPSGTLWRDFLFHDQLPLNISLDQWMWALWMNWYFAPMSHVKMFSGRLLLYFFMSSGQQGSFWLCVETSLWSSPSHISSNSTPQPTSSFFLFLFPTF